MSAKASRTVTRPRCITCGKKFISRRGDARYCSGRCRQRANRARHTSADIDNAIEAARLHYWALIKQKATSLGKAVSQVLTDEAQFVDADGNVYMCGADIGPNGPRVGTMTPRRPGWAAWGLETARPPFCAPPATSGKRIDNWKQQP
jgi:hypothetical protein